MRYAYISEMPTLIADSRNVCLIIRISQNKPVILAVFNKPAVNTFAVKLNHFSVIIICSGIKAVACLVFAVTRNCNVICSGFLSGVLYRLLIYLYLIRLASVWTWNKNTCTSLCRFEIIKKLIHRFKHGIVYKHIIVLYSHRIRYVIIQINKVFSVYFWFVLIIYKYKLSFIYVFV